METINLLILRHIRTCIFAVVFIVGNLLLPYIVHHIPPMFSNAVSSGQIWLPIYFFTLIAAYRYGFVVGLITAVLSPILNSLFFGMPMMEMLPIILVKSSLLSVFATIFAQKTNKVSFWAVLATVVSYQLIGSIIEGIGYGFENAFNDFHLGFAGIILQMTGGYAILKALTKLFD
jgi:thiamine transporter ThiT